MSHIAVLLATSLLLTNLPINETTLNGPPSPPSHTIHFSGHEWEVTDGLGAPHASDWSKQNVWVDDQGRLHLKLTFKDGKWRGAQIMTKQKQKHISSK